MWNEDLSDDEIDTEEPDGLLERFLWAILKGDFDLVKKVLQEDESILNQCDRYGYTALHRASSEGHVEIVQFLLTKQADVNARTMDGWSPLHCACKWNQSEIALLLIQNGSNINAVSNGNATPLHVAAGEKKTRDVIVLLLHCHDVDITIRNNAGDTAFDLTKRSNCNSPLFEIMSAHINKF